MIPYNDNITILQKPDKDTAKVWADIAPPPITPKFTKNDIKKWWDHKKYNCLSSIQVNTRTQAKNDLSVWFGTKIEQNVFESLYEDKGEKHYVRSTFNTKQTGNDWSRRS